MNTSGFNIGVTERETGLSKDVFRVWERRYGFPVPERDANGERVYPAEQVERLRLIKRLMDQGYRPGKLIATPMTELAQLAPRHSRQDQEEREDLIDKAGQEELLALIKGHDAHSYVAALQHRLARHGMQSFVQDVVAPLTRRVGDAWVVGLLGVFEEHLFTELTKRVLRQAITALPHGGGSPRVLLTSAPDEQHILGLLMVEALFTLEGAACTLLGTQMPLLEISRAATAHQADIVALSFSAAFPHRHVAEHLVQLRQLLPSSVALWVGGRGVDRTNPPHGVLRLRSLEDGVKALADWRRSTNRQ